MVPLLAADAMIVAVGLSVNLQLNHAFLYQPAIDRPHLAYIANAAPNSHNSQSDYGSNHQMFQGRIQCQSH